jgi:hypothetical protein
MKSKRREILDGSCPEEQTVRSREIRINKSMIRSALVTAGLLLAAGVLGVTWLRRKD